MARRSNVGQFIRFCRRLHDLTQTQLAERLGTTSATVKNWECGRVTPPIARCVDLAFALGFDARDLMEAAMVDRGVAVPGR